MLLSREYKSYVYRFINYNMKFLYIICSPWYHSTYIYVHIIYIVYIYYYVNNGQHNDVYILHM